jgi:putative redox protein
MFRVESHTIDGGVTALGWAGPHTVVFDRPVEAGGGGRGFNGGELLHLAVACCISNDLFREAALRDVALDHVSVRVDGDFDGAPAVSTGMTYDVELSGPATDAELEALVHHVDQIAEIPNSLRGGTDVALHSVTVRRGG